MGPDARRRTYRAGDREGYATIGFGFLAAGGAFVLGGLLWTLGLVDVNGANRPASAVDVAGVVLAVGIGAAAAFVGWRHPRRPYELRLSPDGTLEVRTVLGGTRVRVRDVAIIEWATARRGVEEGDARELRIRHGRGTIAVGSVRDAERFIADVRAITPRIEVRGRR